MSQTEKPLTPKQIGVLTALFETADISQAADVGGVSRRTVHRWLAEDSAFQAAMAEAETKALARASGRLVRLADKALSTVENVLDSETATTAHRLRGADIALGNLLRLRELITLEARLEAIEKKVFGEQ
jgi:hypothetical protein